MQNIHRCDVVTSKGWRFTVHLKGGEGGWGFRVWYRLSLTILHSFICIPESVQMYRYHEYTTTDIRTSGKLQYEVKNSCFVPHRHTSTFTFCSVSVRVQK